MMRKHAYGFESTIAPVIQKLKHVASETSPPSGHGRELWTTRRCVVEVPDGDAVTVLPLIHVVRARC